MCSLRDFSRALYPLAVRRRAPRWLTFWPWPGELRGQDRRRPLAPGGSRAPKIASALNLHPKGPALITFVHYARARGGAEPAAGRFSFCESGWRRSRSVRRRRRAQRATGSTSPPAACTGKLMGLGRVLAPRFQPCPLSVGGTAPRAALAYFLALAGGATGSGSPPAARTRRVSRSENRECIESASKGPALITFVHYARARGGAEPAAGRFSFCESGWRRSRSVRRRRRAQRATGSTSPPAACTGKLMGLGRVLAPRFQPCPLSVGGTAPRAALAYFLALAGELRGQDRRRPLAPGGSRAPKIASALNSASERARVDHFCALRARARRSRARRRPIFFLRIRLAAQQECSAAAPSAASYGVTSPPAACTGKLMGLGRVLAPRFQPCPLSVGGTAPRAALAYFLALAGGATGSGSPPAARTRRVSRSENRECIEFCIRKGPR